MCGVNSIKYMIVNQSEGVYFGVKGDNCLVLKKLKKCFLVGIGEKGKQAALIVQINKFAESLKKGGY